MTQSSNAVSSTYVRRAASLALAVSAGLAAGAAAQTASTYQKPPAAIEELLDAPHTPSVSVSPDRTMLLIEQAATFPSIADVAQPRYRLAGLRFAPRTSSPSAETYSVAISLQALGGGEKKITGLPEKPRFTEAFWSPDSKHVAFLQRVDAATPAGGGPGLQLWVIDVASARAHRVGLIHLNAVLGRPCPGCRIAPRCSAGSFHPRVPPRPKQATSPPAQTSLRTWAKSAPRPLMKTCCARRKRRTSSSTTPPRSLRWFCSRVRSSPCPSKA